MNLLTRGILGQRLASIRPTRTTLTSRFCRTVLIQRFNSTDTPVNPVPQSLKDTGLQDTPHEVVVNEGTGSKIDWSKSFHGLSIQPFSKDIVDILQAPVDVEDVEMSPEGLVYLPASSYVRILTQAFGPGGWSMAPRSEAIVTENLVTQEYALICHGRFISVARGEQIYFDPNAVRAAMEQCKNSAMTRCCKDLGIASDLWNPRWIREFKKQHCESVWGEHMITLKKRKLWVKKGDTVKYPYQLDTA